MKTGKHDLRVKLTEAMLTDAFLELRREKPLGKITVRELCERAGIGRGTFYAHYCDVYDLNDKLESELFGQFSAALNGALKSNNIRSTLDACRTVFSLLSENKTLCKLILFDRDMGAAKRFIEYGEQLCLGIYRRADVPEEKIRRFYRFVSTGCIACMQAWLSDPGHIGVEEFSEEMSKLISSGANYLS